VGSLPGGSGRIRVLVADDHRMARAGLALLLKLQADIDVVGEADDGYEALRLATALRPDVLLADISMPGPSGIELAAVLRERLPDVRVVVLTMHEDANLVREALAAGAYGYIIKRAAEVELVAAIRNAALGNVYVDREMQRLIVTALPESRGRPADSAGRAAVSATAPGADPVLSGLPPLPLSDSERTLLRLLARGFTMQQIAENLHITSPCAEEMRKDLSLRLGLQSRVDIMRFARDHDILGA
jgi:two-component system, NarL family, response regulator NreC